MLSGSEIKAMKLALAQAATYRGATAPNPPVGAAALTETGDLLLVAAHERAGTAHAEARVLEECAQAGTLAQLHTLVITLEPCNHQGRTPPCTDAILRAGVRRVVFATLDPNPKVRGGGTEMLRTGGVEVIHLNELTDSGALAGESHADEIQSLVEEARELIRPFAHWARTGLPWVTLKTAWTREGSMIPPTGKKTFTSESSLRVAHELRKRADAILTGSGTVLSDWPEFTVRRVPDHPDKHRVLAVLDRRGRVPENYLDQKRTQGFQVLRHTGELRDVLAQLGASGVLEVLIEAGPTLASRVLHEGLWNQHVNIRQYWADTPDTIEIRANARAATLPADEAPHVHRNH